MSFVAAAVAVGTAAYSGYQGRKAASEQKKSARAGMANDRYIFDRQTELNAPFRDAGIDALDRMKWLLGIGRSDRWSNKFAERNGGYGSLNKEFGESDFKADPGYAFRLSEGLKALDRQAAARGGLISGGALKAASRYGQDMASQEYQNAFNRYQINRANKLQPLQSMAGMGQSATNLLTGAAGDYGNRWNANNAASANASAAQSVGTANAVVGGVNNFMNYYQNQQWMNKLYPGGNTAAG